MKSIRKIRVTIEPDECLDYSYIGEYTDTYDEWHIDCASGEYTHDLEAQARAEWIAENPDEDPDDADGWEQPSRGRELRYFAPYAGGETPGTDEYQIYGKQDFARMDALNRGDWQFIGVRATAEIIVNGTTQTVYSGGLWGIESDSEHTYLEDAATAELAQLADTLRDLGFSQRAISKASPTATQLASL